MYMNPSFLISFSFYTWSGDLVVEVLEGSSFPVFNNPSLYGVSHISLEGIFPVPRAFMFSSVYFKYLLIILEYILFRVYERSLISLSMKYSVLTNPWMVRAGREIISP